MVSLYLPPRRLCALHSSTALMKRDINKHRAGRNVATPERERARSGQVEQARGGVAGCSKVRKVGQCVGLGGGRRAGIISRGAAESRLHRQSPDQSPVSQSVCQCFCLESRPTLPRSVCQSSGVGSAPSVRLPPSALSPHPVVLPPFLPLPSSRRLIWRESLIPLPRPATQQLHDDTTDPSA